MDAAGAREDLALALLRLGAIVGAPEAGKAVRTVAWHSRRRGRIAATVRERGSTAVQLLGDGVHLGAEGPLLDALLLPGVFLGFWLGRSLLKKISQNHFEWILIFMAFGAALRMVTKT